jgi:NADH-quinone oxidoreductase subunit C
MNTEQLKNRVLQIVPEAEFDENEYLNALIPSESVHKLMSELRNGEDTLFDYLFCLTGVDWPEHMWVVYHLKSTSLEHSLVIKAILKDRRNPFIETVSDIWQTAEYHERETYDFFGIKFLNHPDLRRIFLEEDWKGFPLLKDYVDEVNIIDL